VVVVDPARGSGTSRYNRSLLTPAQCDRAEVILVSPRNPLNIGAAARAMANFGFHRLSIVAPFAVNWMEAKSAVGAPDLLREAKVYETLAEAVASCTLVFGTGSLDRRRPVQAILDLPEAAAQLRHALAINSEAGKSRVAIVFGSEKHGLTTDDLSWCHALIAIETCEAQPSMNLGQAVAVCLYEISRNGTSGTEEALLEPPQPDSGQLDRLAGLIEQTMEAVNYSTRGMRSANGEALRVLLRRLMPDEADLRRMMGLFRRILWQLAKRDGKV
jgi:TrmH family RNA methyltransferase